MADSTPLKRRWLVPAIRQSSPADSATAALLSISRGCGRHPSLRRADAGTIPQAAGTLDIETSAQRLGITLSRREGRADFAAVDTGANLPAVVVTASADAGIRCVVLWRKVGPWMQVMDPAVGRSWMRCSRVAPWLRAGAAESALPLWEDAGHENAAAEWARHLHGTGQLRYEEFDEFHRLCARYPADIPEVHWKARRANARRDTVCSVFRVDRVDAPLITETPAPGRSPWAPVWSFCLEQGWLLPAAALSALIAVAAGTVFEALLFRGLFDLGRHLPSAAQRLCAMGAVLTFLGVLVVLDWPATLTLFRAGRSLDVLLRTRFLAKVARLDDVQAQSRPPADMAYRAHSLQLLRQLPEATGYGTYLVSNLLITAVAVGWLYPGSGYLIGLAVIAACGVPALFAPAMAQRDLRYREASAALSGVFLESLLGSRAIQAHSAQETAGVAHARQRRVWSVAALHQQALYVAVDAAQMIPTYACVVMLVYRQIAEVQSPAGLLLLIYWAMSIPLLGRELATLARRFPAMHNTLLRFADVESATDAPVEHRVGAGAAHGIKITFDAATVIVAGRRVLDRIELHVAPGEHVAIVGKSGAGKSSLVGCLLGWHRPASGHIAIDDAPLDGARLWQLRRETAWIDPQVHVFRGTLLDNLRYGNGRGADAHAAQFINLAELAAMVERSPQGLQAGVGEGGALISEGEAQRLRIARAFGRADVRLAICDEPVRGLGRPQRQRFLGMVRARFHRATLLCITHDVSDALDFDRVLVMEQGQIVEHGAPRTLQAAADSRFRQLLDEEALVARDLWGHAEWRRWNLHEGTVRELKSAAPAVDLVRDSVGRRTG